MFQHILLRDRSVHLKTSNLQLAIWNMPGDDSEVFWERITYICWIFGFKGCILIWNVNMYACVYVNIKWIIYVHMYIYIYFSYAIHTLSLSPYYCIHIHIFMAQTHFGTLNVFLFNFTGPGWTNPCWIAPCLWMRSVVGCQTETNRSTWRESLGPSESPTTSECSMQVGCGRSGHQLTPVGRTIH